MELLSLDPKSLLISVLPSMTCYSKEKSGKLYGTQLGSLQRKFFMGWFEQNYFSGQRIRNDFFIYMF